MKLGKGSWSPGGVVAVSLNATTGRLGDAALAACGAALPPLSVVNLVAYTR